LSDRLPTEVHELWRNEFLILYKYFIKSKKGKRGNIQPEKGKITRIRDYYDSIYSYQHPLYIVPLKF
jgi:hypothetical protein